MKMYGKNGMSSNELILLHKPYHKHSKFMQNCIKF